MESMILYKTITDESCKEEAAEVVAVEVEEVNRSALRQDQQRLHQRQLLSCLLLVR